MVQLLCRKDILEHAVELLPFVEDLVQNGRDQPRAPCFSVDEDVQTWLDAGLVAAAVEFLCERQA